MDNCKKCGTKGKSYRLGDKYQTCTDCGHKQKRDKKSLAIEHKLLKTMDWMSTLEE